jgi:hypothetical protein
MKIGIFCSYKVSIAQVLSRTNLSVLKHHLYEGLVHAMFTPGIESTLMNVLALMSILLLEVVVPDIILNLHRS